LFVTYTLELHCLSPSRSTFVLSPPLLFAHSCPDLAAAYRHFLELRKRYPRIAHARLFCFEPADAQVDGVDSRSRSSSRSETSSFSSSAEAGRQPIHDSPSQTGVANTHGTAVEADSQANSAPISSSALPPPRLDLSRQPDLVLFPRCADAEPERLRFYLATLLQDLCASVLRDLDRAVCARGSVGVGWVWRAGVDAVRVRMMSERGCVHMNSLFTLVCSLQCNHVSTRSK
jgi:hypothetical protein